MSETEQGTVGRRNHEAASKVVFQEALQQFQLFACRYWGISWGAVGDRCSLQMMQRKRFWAWIYWRFILIDWVFIPITHLSWAFPCPQVVVNQNSILGICHLFRTLYQKEQVSRKSLSLKLHLEILDAHSTWSHRGDSFVFNRLCLCKEWPPG